ncbi:MAG: UbiD family decarboxylase, partial [Desulfitobacteriaceae bacterium]|nr:UbiD family decarboxylase [Desulfitobacteriaceae bacterium]
MVEQGHSVKVLTVSSYKYPFDPSEIPVDYLESTLIEAVEVDLHVRPLPAFLNLFTRKSYHVERFINKSFRKRLIRILSEQEFDIVQLETVFMAPYIPDIRKHSRAKIVLRAHNIEHLIWKRIHDNTRWVPKKAYLRHLWKTLKNFELSTLSRVDGIAAITKKDANFFRQYAGTVPVIDVSFGVDLSAFPWPHLYARDGGRYMTAGVIIVQNRAGTWVNWSVCRGLINGRDKLVLNITPDSHLARLHREYEEKGEPMPASIVLGGDPACFIAAALNVPWGMSEAAIAGGLKGNPVALVRSETNSLLVPAGAEVVLEGEILPGERLPEGPFPEYVRYAPSQLRPVFFVRAITHRKNPIIPFVAEGVKVSDSMALRSVLISLELMDKLRRQTQLKVRWINLPVEAKLGLCVAACDPV